MIPEFIDIGSPWKVLPPGVYIAVIKEIEVRFATTNYRKYLFSGFKEAISSLYEAGCNAVFLDGSYITAKPIPGDYDVCWDTEGVNPSKLDPVFRNFSDNRKEQKLRYYGEFFPIHFLADGVSFFYNFFQIDKYTGKAKGIIKIDLKTIQC